MKTVSVSASAPVDVKVKVQEHAIFNAATYKRDATGGWVKNAQPRKMAVATTSTSDAFVVGPVPKGETWWLATNGILSALAGAAAVKFHLDISQPTGTASSDEVSGLVGAGQASDFDLGFLLVGT